MGAAGGHFRYRTPRQDKHPADKDGTSSTSRLSRRELLGTTAVWLLFSATSARALVVQGNLPWAPNAGAPPAPVHSGPWVYLTPEEGAAVEALVDRLIPPDPQTPGGKDAGCAVFVDRQLAGPYVRREGLYLRPPFQSGTKSQGDQSERGPAQTYREGLAAIDRACKDLYGKRVFAELSVDERIEFLRALEDGELRLEGVDGRSFFAQVVKDVQIGFFADPLYGGNRDMVAWKMIGYPGARYNYLDWIDRHNERFPLPPVSLMGRAEWTPKG